MSVVVEVLGGKFVGLMDGRRVVGEEVTGMIIGLSAVGLSFVGHVVELDVFVAIGRAKVESKGVIGLISGGEVVVVVIEGEVFGHIVGLVVLRCVVEEVVVSLDEFEMHDCRFLLKEFSSLAIFCCFCIIIVRLEVVG